LLNFDFMLYRLNKSLYKFGISLSPGNAIIGYDEWLFLGDNYSSTRTVTRRGLTPNDLEIGSKISKGAVAWDQYLKSKGVQLYRVMVAPNKGTIYPEFLPNWAKPATQSATNALINSVSDTIYTDLRRPLLEAKKFYHDKLFRRTDTHWTSLGAMVGFLSFSKRLQISDSSIRWPSDEQLKLLRIDKKQGGDLARFLRLEKDLPDIDPIIDINFGHPLTSQHFDFKTGASVKPDENISIVYVFTEGALNKKRLLWLRDSFGTAVSPFMCATFTENLQLHWGEAFKDNGRRLIELVDAWKPDYVFVTVVEREAFSELFTNPPPM